MLYISICGYDKIRNKIFNQSRYIIREYKKTNISLEWLYH